jgi:hypothetical protein
VDDLSTTTFAPDGAAETGPDDGRVVTTETAKSNGSAPEHRPTFVGRLVRRVPGRAWTLAGYAMYFIAANYVVGRLWLNPRDRLLVSNITDHVQFQWFFAHDAWAVAHLHNPLVTDHINVPGQVNLMANTSMLGMGIPLAPVTLLFGPAVSVAVALVLCLALTAGAWFWVLSRLVTSRFAAWVGGAFMGFAPGMVSQAGGHPNIIAQFLIPLIIWRVIRMRDREHPVRNGLILGLLVAYQMFLNEELLFLTWLGCSAFVLVYAVQRRQEARAALRPYLVGLGVAAVTAGVLLAYPLWFQFFGPGHYRGLPFELDRFVMDLGSMPAYSRESLAGDPLSVRNVSISPTEENAFFGWSLLGLLVLIVVWLRRRPVVWATVVTGAVFGALAVGPTIVYKSQSTGIPGPLRWLGDVPPFDLATPSRYALGLIPVVGILLTLASAEAERLAATWPKGYFPVRLVWWGAVVAALLPIAPTPLPTFNQQVPTFITSGAWRPYLDGGRTLVTVPLARNDHTEGIRWQAVSGMQFAIAGGYFIGPRSSTDPSAIWETPERPTKTILDNVAHFGVKPRITPTDRANARADLKYWRAGLVVLQKQKYLYQLIVVVTDLLGFPPTETGGVWVWDVRELAGAGPTGANGP